MLNQSSRLFSTPPIISEPTIQLLQSKDIAQFTAIARQVYDETYPNFFTPTQMDELFNAAFQEQIANELQDPNKVYFVVKQDKMIIGYAKLILNQELSILDKLYILRSYHRQGLGSKLMQACYQTAHERNCFRMKVLVSDLNFKVIPFYEKHGFKMQDEKVPYYYSNGSDSKSCDWVMLCEDIKPYVALKMGRSIKGEEGPAFHKLNHSFK